MNALEAAVRRAYLEWSRYAKFTHCAVCGQAGHLRAARVRGPFLCLACFDQEVK